MQHCPAAPRRFIESFGQNTENEEKKLLLFETNTGPGFASTL